MNSYSAERQGPRGCTAGLAPPAGVRLAPGTEVEVGPASDCRVISQRTRRGQDEHQAALCCPGSQTPCPTSQAARRGQEAFFMLNIFP